MSDIIFWYSGAAIWAIIAILAAGGITVAIIAGCIYGWYKSASWTLYVFIGNNASEKINRILQEMNYEEGAPSREWVENFNRRYRSNGKHR